MADPIAWIPAFAGMTKVAECTSFRQKPESSPAVAGLLRLLRCYNLRVPSGMCAIHHSHSCTFESSIIPHSDRQPAQPCRLAISC